jgi:hypothetical protein
VCRAESSLRLSVYRCLFKRKAGCLSICSRHSRIWKVEMCHPSCTSPRLQRSPALCNPSRQVGPHHLQIQGAGATTLCASRPPCVCLPLSSLVTPFCPCSMQPRAVPPFHNVKSDSPMAAAVRTQTSPCCLNLFPPVPPSQLRAIEPIMGQGLSNLRPDSPKAYALYTLLVSEVTWMLMLVRGYSFWFLSRGTPFPTSVWPLLRMAGH